MYAVLHVHSFHVPVGYYYRYSHNPHPIIFLGRHQYRIDIVIIHSHDTILSRAHHNYHQCKMSYLCRFFS